MKKQITIKIDAEFGSKAQAKSALGALKITVPAWATFYTNSHKKNKIDVKFTEVDL